MLLLRCVSVLIFLCSTFCISQAFGDNQNLEDIQLFLQRPSYVLFEDDIFICDINREECKVNLRFGFDKDKNISSKIICELSADFLSEDIHKCNPNTIIVPNGEHEFIMRLYHKDLPDKVIIKNYIFRNSIPDITTHSGSIDEKDDEIISNEVKVTKNISEEVVLSPKIQELDTSFEYQLQRPSDIVGSGGIFTCYKDDNGCRLNLKLVHKSSQKDIGSKFVCEIDFGFDSEQSMRCNPNTVIIPENIDLIQIKVYQKNLPENFSYSQISMSHINIPIKESSSQSVSNEINEVIKPYLLSKIVIQSKDSKTRKISGNRIECYDVDRCNINLDASVDTNGIKKDISYTWSFGDGEEIRKKNPSGIWFEKGGYRVKLEVYDKYDNINRHDVFVMVHGKQQEIQTDVIDEIQINKKQENKDMSGLQIFGILSNPESYDDNEWIEIKNISDKAIDLKGLQIDDIIGKGSKPYLIEDNIILQPGDIKRFHKQITGLSLGNTTEEVHIIYNGKTIDSYVWDVSIPDNFIIDTNNENNIGEYIDIFLSRDTESVDSEILETHEEEGKFKPNFSQSIAKQKKSLKIYGKTIPNTAIEILFGNQTYYITSNEKGSYSLKLNSLDPGEFKVISKVLGKNGEIYEVPRVKTVLLDREYINVMNQTNAIIAQNKSKKSSKSNSLNTSNKKELSIIPKAQVDDGLDVDSSINFKLLHLLLGTMSSLMGYLVLRKNSII